MLDERHPRRCPCLSRLLLDVSTVSSYTAYIHLPSRSRAWAPISSILVLSLTLYPPFTSIYKAQHNLLSLVPLCPLFVRVFSSSPSPPSLHTHIRLNRKVLKKSAETSRFLTLPSPSRCISSQTTSTRSLHIPLFSEVILSLTSLLLCFIIIR